MNPRVQTVVDVANDLCMRARAERAKKAAGIHPAVLLDSGYALAGRGTVAACCGRGKPVYRDGMCVCCAEDAFDARNRALPAHEQRD